MKNDLQIKNNIVIPGNEIEISTSKSGGPGGQHVNKTDTRIIIRWNIKKTTALSEKQKNQAIQSLEKQLTKDGELIIQSDASHSQLQNKQTTLGLLVKKICKALYVPKKRITTHIPRKSKESRLQTKKHRSEIKKMRNKKMKYE